VALIVVNRDARTPVASRSDRGECRLHHPFSIASATEVQNQQPTRPPLWAVGRMSTNADDDA